VELCCPDNNSFALAYPVNPWVCFRAVPELYERARLWQTSPQK